MAEMAIPEIRANVEQPRIAWLSSPEYTITESFCTLRDQIKDIVEHLYVCKSIEDCEHFIRGKHGHPPYEQVFLIVTTDYVHRILEQGIHDVRVLQAILVFHPNKGEFSSIFQEYRKVEGIYSNPNELLMQLSRSVDHFSRESGILISTLKGCNVEMMMNIINNFADFSELWFPLFIDLLFDLPTPSDITRAEEIKQFASQCQRFYAHNQQMLAQLQEFLSSQNGYSANVAVKYYTRDFFLFKRTNKALRQQNFQAIFDFRFFLVDMQAQLQAAYSVFSHAYDIGDVMEFFRGQRMLKEELESLREKRRTGSLITVNSYLSASISRDVAMSFIRECQNGELIPVILIIQAKFKDPTVTRRKPFSYIGDLSHCSDELEVLFSVGSFFRVDDIKFDDNDKVHVIELTFIYDEEHCTITDDYGTLKTCSLEEKVFKTGDLLYKHAKHGALKTNAFYQRFLCGTYSPLIKAACHTGLGWLALKQKQFDVAIEHEKQAIQMYQSFNDTDCSKYLYVTSYNCLGGVYQQQKQYSKALSYYVKAHGLGPNTVPIDKYALYNSFNNIASINIACISKIQGSIDRAWSTYKEVLALQMTTSTRFHGATFLKIAEADFSEASNLLDNNNEQMNHWKDFLDYSLTDMSASYRRSIVSGVLSIGLRFANNEQNWNQAIDYYKKIIEISQKYIIVSPEDYNIVLQCHQQIVELFRKKRNYVLSIKYASDGLNLCRMDDLELYTKFYESMIETYEKQLQQLNSNLSPEDIDFQIVPDLPPSSRLSCICRTTSTDQTIVLRFERDEFSFGQYRKALNVNLLKEPNLKRCLAYCLLKLAALKNEQVKTKDIPELIYRVSTLIPDDKQIQFICKNNRAYLHGNFKEIINEYETSLKENCNDNKKLCVGEDAYCYIAHLYGRSNDPNAEQEWYRKAIAYFKEHKFVCQHTRSCFVKTASYYQTKNDLSSCVSTYLKLVHHLLEYRSETFQLQRDVVVIVESILQSSSNADDKDQVEILKRLVQLVLRSSENVNLLDSDFQWIIKRYRKNMKQSWTATHAYEAYLNHILQHVTRPLASYVQTIVPLFLQATTVYKLRDDPTGALDVYQRLVNIILKYSTDRDHIISAFKGIVLDLEQKGQTKAVLNTYEALRQFIYAHPAEINYEDDNLISYILDRFHTLIERNKEAAASIYRTIIRMVRSYREVHNPDLSTKLYLEWVEKYYTKLALVEPLSALDCYSNLLDIFLNLRPEEFDKMLAKIVAAMEDQPRELLELLTKYRVDYRALIQHAYRQLLHPTDQSIMCEIFPQTRSSFLNNVLSSYAKKAKRCYTLSKVLNNIIECWKKCLYFLLEVCSENDAYFAACYTKLADPERAANVFDPTVYLSFTVKYCPNACRRYLKYVYLQSQMRDELELVFADHFYCVDGKKKIRPLEPVNY